MAKIKTNNINLSCIFEISYTNWNYLMNCTIFFYEAPCIYKYIIQMRIQHPIVHFLVYLYITILHLKNNTALHCIFIIEENDLTIYKEFLHYYLSRCNGPVSIIVFFVFSLIFFLITSGFHLTNLNNWISIIYFDRCELPFGVPRIILGSFKKFNI